MICMYMTCFSFCYRISLQSVENIYDVRKAISTCNKLTINCFHTHVQGSYVFLFCYTIQVSTILAMPCWQKAVVKFGKKTTFAAGMIVRTYMFIA